MMKCEHDKFKPIKEIDKYGLTMVYALQCKNCGEEFVIKPVTESTFDEIAKENNLI